jgi:uncharacterized membrane protein YqjE
VSWIAKAARAVDGVLRADRRSLAARGWRSQFALLAACVIGGAGVYGAAMGSFGGRGWQMVYSACKAPLLMFGAAAVALPSCFMMTTVLGLRDDFPRLARSAFAAQATMALVLASLAPAILFLYCTTNDYDSALLYNGAIFLLASVAAQWKLRRLLADFLARGPAARLVLRIWLGVYVFVAIELAWIMRPYIGTPGTPTAFFRVDSFGNAYEVVCELVWNWLHRRLFG